SRVGPGRRGDVAALLLGLGADPQGAGDPGRAGHAPGLAGPRPGRGGRDAAGGGARGRLRPAPPTRPRLPRGREGDGPRALVARRRQFGCGHRRARARGHRLRRAGVAAARPPRRNAGAWPGRAEGEDLSHRPYRLLRRLRHHDRARGGRARARRARRRDRTRRRGQPRARGVRAHPSVTRARVLVREQIADAGVELLRERFDVDVDANGDLAATIGDYDAIVIRSATKLTADVIERAERLKVIGRAGVGVDNVDVEAATRRGIVVANAPESTVTSAAEHTLGPLVPLSRSIPQAHASLKEGKWDRSRFGGLELAGKTLGLVGFGRIGQQVARRARALEMDVLAYDPYVAAGRFRELGVEQVGSLEDLLARSDFLSLHLTLAPETYRLIGKEQLAAAKDGIR